jgi:hypothetical protein
MATASQKMMLIKFFVLIRGAATPPPMMLDPVKKIPLQDNRPNEQTISLLDLPFIQEPYQAAPTTDREMAKAMPIPAHMCGDVSARKLHHTASTEDKRMDELEIWKEPHSLQLTYTH